MKKFNIDFENDNFGICILAESKDEAIKIVENPFYWKDNKRRIVSYIQEV